MSSDHAQLVARLKELGYKIEQTPSGHLAVKDGLGHRLITMSVSPSSKYAQHKIRRDLKRAGVVL